MPRATHTTAVRVTVEWKYKGVRITPWQVEARPGQKISWRLVGADAIAVSHKKGRSWPMGKKKYKGPGVTGAVKGKAKLRKYRYDIRLYVGGDEYLVDPEMIIRR